mgnify:CR=1 FL=1
MIKVRKSSPVPIPTTSKPKQKFIEPIEIEPEEVKEVVKDFGGEDNDESYEDDGAEMGDGAEGTDGTGRHTFFKSF